MVIHGGPAAAGSVAKVARELSRWCRVLEPWQRGSGAEPLTVQRHVADLHALIESRCRGEHPALIGASWGAMLALAYAATHPAAAGPLVLVGCGTFDLASREQLQATLAARTSEEMRAQLKLAETDSTDPGRRMQRQHEIQRSAFLYAPLPAEPEDPAAPPFDVRAHLETWSDMLELQARGVYPAAFGAITSPVLMLHGDYDPHPGPMIRDCLRAHIRQLSYRELERCGHEPWLERHAREPFFTCLRELLAQNQ